MEVDSRGGRSESRERSARVSLLFFVNLLWSRFCFADLAFSSFAVCSLLFLLLLLGQVESRRGSRWEARRSLLE